MHCILIMGVILALANMSLYLTNNTAYCVLDLAYNCAIESGKKSHFLGVVVIFSYLNQFYTL